MYSSFEEVHPPHLDTVVSLFLKNEIISKPKAASHYQRKSGNLTIHKRGIIQSLQISKKKNKRKISDIYLMSSINTFTGETLAQSRTYVPEKGKKEDERPTAGGGLQGNIIRGTDRL